MEDVLADVYEGEDISDMEDAYVGMYSEHEKC